ncbi:MAG TPA: vWA domain-containing protein [Gaiellaceae bacterium]|nr:vWA domain-containing protein [Gaiellaceae bacterium]
MAARRALPVPTSEPAPLRRAARRTLAVRLALAAALLAALAGAALVARGEDVRTAPLVPSGKTGLVVLDLSASTSERAFAQTIEKLAEADERVGLIAFSDAAYELLPIGTPGRELLPLLRYFSSEGGREPPAHHPWEEFRAGTRISEGLRVAGDVFERERVREGSLLLVSDFEILPDEIQRVAGQVALLRERGVEIRLVPLDPTPERRARMNAILGGAAVLRANTADAPVRAPEADTLGAAAPWAFVAVAALLVALLAVNERLLSRLEVWR